VGSGTTRDEAEAAAKRDLISNALTETARTRGSGTARIQVDAEVAAAFELPGLRPVARDESSGGETVMLSIKAAKFDEHERAREAALRTEVQERFSALQQGHWQPPAERMREAASLLDRLAREGVAGLLTQDAQGGRLVSAAIEAFCRQLFDGLSITTSPEGGFVGSETRLEASVQSGGGTPSGSLPLRVEWTPGGGKPALLQVTSEADGRVSLAYPQGQAFRNNIVRLRVSTDFARWAASPVLAEIDAASTVQTSFRHFDDVNAHFSSEVLVPSEPLTATTFTEDTGETQKQAVGEAIEANTMEFYVDLYPVTNGLYRMYLEDTRAETFPEFWDNPRYNQPDQPVVGVSYADAVRFASWLSGQLGVVKRLPTEDEWERAARGGREVIYPWGDESPGIGERANYSGNGRFDSTSPVGSYEEGRNAYGIFDMAGNVWEWTSTKEETGSRIAKGGSWMDGPSDLRISNRREINPSRGYADVGFRLIREVTDEKNDE
jgi:hypothetical protein